MLRKKAVLKNFEKIIGNIDDGVFFDKAAD